jgi:methionyl-tRNA synthetase
MPTVTDKLMAQLGLPASAGMDLSDAALAATAAPHRLLPSGHSIGTPQPIFRNIPEEEIEEYRGRYAGSQKDDGARFRVSRV